MDKDNDSCQTGKHIDQLERNTFEYTLAIGITAVSEKLHGNV